MVSDVLWPQLNPVDAEADLKLHIRTEMVQKLICLCLDVVKGAAVVISMLYFIHKWRKPTFRHQLKFHTIKTTKKDANGVSFKCTYYGIYLEHDAQLMLLSHTKVP